MKKESLFKGFFLVIFIISLITMLTSCGYLGSSFLEFKGELIGNSYQVWEFDNHGNRILTLKGNRIALDGGVDALGAETSYLNITIDGEKWEHVGGTLVFAQNDADMITDFQIPEDTMELESSSSGLISVDRVINNYRNYFGKKSVVVVYSQTGVPICMFQGDYCYTSVPEDLPKTTMIYIDGALVYVHRANIDIFPAKLFE